MGDIGVVHVFIGAPTIGHTPPERLCGNPAAMRRESDAWSHFHKGEHLSLQGDRPGKTCMHHTVCACHREDHAVCASHREDHTECGSHREDHMECAGHRDDHTICGGHKEDHASLADHREYHTSFAGHREDHTTRASHREDHTSLASHREDHTLCAGHREDHTSCVGHREDHTARAGYREDHTSFVGHREDHTSCAGYQEDHTSCVGHREDHVSHAGHRKDHTSLATHREDHASGGGHREDHASGGGHREDQASGGGHREDHASGGGHREDHASGAGHREDHASGAGHREDHASGAGHREDHASGAGHREDHASGAGHREDHASGAGHREDHASGAGHREDHASGAGHREDHASGAGHREDHASGAGHREDHASGAGHREDHASGAGHREDHASGAGHREDHASGAGHREDHASGAGHREDHASGAGHREDHASGAGHREDHASGAGHREDHASGAGHREDHASGAGHWEDHTACAAHQHQTVCPGSGCRQRSSYTECDLLHGSSTEHCPHRPAASLLCDFSDLSVHEEDGGSRCDLVHSDCISSTESEFLAVLASSQHAVQNSETCQVKMRELERSPSPKFTSLSNDPSQNGSGKRKTTSLGTLYLPSSTQISKKPKQSRSSVQRGSKESDDRRPQTSLKPLTLLKHCIDKNKQYNILAVVLQPSHVKEIRAKSGPNSGLSFPLATIVVLDQSGVKCNIIIWRNAAFWSLSLFPGDIIMLTNLTVCEDKWSKETFLQSTFNSSFLNLGNGFILIADEYSNIVEYFVLKELLYYLFTKHCYLRDLPSHPPQKLDCVQHVGLSQLQPEVLVHSILKVVGISILKERTYHFKGLQQNKIILTVEEVKGQTGTLILWGTGVSWCEKIRMKRDFIWVFKNLLCKKNLISGDLELHTTPWSSCECLFDDDKRAIDFKNKYENGSHPKLLSLRTVIEGRYLDDIQIKVRISELIFLVPDNQNICVNKHTSITKILNYLPLVIYSGCGKCRKELKIDSNHVIEQCAICLPLNQIRLFYRSVLMTGRSEEDEICIHVPPDVLEKIFLNISPNLLHKPVSGSSNVTYGAIVADTCHSLLADNGESYLLTLKSHCSLDENSVPLEQEFHLLSFLVNI
ncbi:shieldin complex subunit 2 [Mantella aurantiaca]